MYKPTTALCQPSASFLFKLSVLATAVAGIGLTTGCSSSPAKAKVQSAKQVGMLDANSLDSLEDLLSATDMRAVEGDRLLILKHGDVWKRMTVGFKMDENKWDPRIDAQRSWFISRQPYIDRLSARASRYLYHTVKEAERRGLPTELALLPVIESSYDPAATSSAAAAGMWQFIPSTGKIYGLRQTSLYDGRRDVVESTRAAYEFLGSLYNQFGSWELALAAYNAGPGRIQQAINRNEAAGLPTDYWSLKLPQETMNYVPRFLAVAQIIKSPQKYGVSLPPIANRPHFREVSVPAGAQLGEIASIVDLSRAELYQLNPGHRGDVIDAQSPMKILIPMDSNPHVDAKLKTLKSSSGSALWASSSSSSNNKASVNSQPALTVSTSIKSNQPTIKTNQAPKPVVVETPKVTNSQPVITASVPKPVVETKPAPVAAKPVENVQLPSLSTTLAGSITTKTPSGSEALAAFASSTVVPSAPRIPVAVKQAENVKPVLLEPPITDAEREKLLAGIAPTQAGASEPNNEEILVQQATPEEKEEVVKEITALVPTGTEVVDPLDGKIRLTAIQTSQSVAAQQGEEVKLEFAYPKSVTENTAANSDEAKRNQGKSFVKTESEVRVVAPAGQRSTYTVSQGDTLAIIAMKNGVNWRDIAKWNQVDPNSTLFVGTTLYLYDAKPQTIEKIKEDKRSETKPTVYLVKPNDTLSGIAGQFNLSVQQLAERNNLTTSSNVLVGQKLNLVDNGIKSGSNSSKTQEKTTQAKVKTKVYTVKRGEYLKLIADRYALSNQELAQLNPSLKADSSLFVGQRINVPLEEVSAKTEESLKESKTQFENVRVQSGYKTENYKVQRGDTLSSIAAQAKLSLSELSELNKFPISKNLLVGENIKIPVNIESTSKSQSDVKNVHVVKSGETLAGIARKYSLQLSYLAGLNGLTTTSPVNIGQKLKIDGDLPIKKVTATSTSRINAKNTESYTVKSGESLNVIANRFGISTRDLAEVNGLTAKSNLQRGQSILVPKTIKDYRIQSGDSLIRLANRYGLETNQLAEMNDMKPNASLKIGDTIKVPNL